MNPGGAPRDFDEVARELTPALRRYLQRYVGNPATAEDLLQETLIRLARGLAEFEGRSSLTTWAFSVATHVATDHFRRPEHRLRIVEMDDAPPLSDPGRAADERLVIDEMNACVRRVIDSLAEDYRAALVLHDLEGLTAQQTAEACGCSLATAKIRLHRARLRLREALGRECEFYRDPDNVLRCDRKA
jgi:RNA polymerase sigma-70 factor (ECF subfamily)